MDISRINDYIDSYSVAIQMPQEYVKILKELMPKIIGKYEKVKPYITVEEDDYKKYVIMPVDGRFSIEDFFLNRMMRNVWFVEQECDTKGAYDARSMTIKFDEDKIKRQLEGIIESHTEEEFKKINTIAQKKVKMHEFEHALQTGYRNGALDIRFAQQYKKIIEEISKAKNGKYAGEIISYEDIREDNGEFEIYSHTGLHCPGESTGVRTYREVERMG